MTLQMYVVPAVFVKLPEKKKKSQPASLMKMT